MVKNININICVLFCDTSQTRITSNTNVGITAHLLGCRVGWTAAHCDIPPGLLSDEVGGVVVSSLPLLVSLVDEDRGAEKRGLLLVEKGPGRRSRVKARNGWLGGAELLRTGKSLVRSGSPRKGARWRGTLEPAGFCWAGLGSQST